MKERTIIGVPFHIGENPEVLKPCLRNLDECLACLGIDAEVVVGVNGSELSDKSFKDLHKRINRSEYNADIRFIQTPPGIVNATKTIGEVAVRQGYRRVFLTDADISRLPKALYYMWQRGETPVVGANYSAYPIEIMIGAGIELTPHEIAFMRIFEADKHPLIRKFTFPYRPQRRLKGSLLLIDAKLLFWMYGSQNITSDSIMNMRVPDKHKQVVSQAGFFHFARVDLTDHFTGRLRHFRAAAAEGNLEEFARRSVIYDREVAKEIAAQVRSEYPGLPEIVSNFFLKYALERKVVEICKKIASSREPAIPVLNTEVDVSSLPVDSLEEAEQVVSALLSRYLKIKDLYTPAAEGKGITNGRFRVPIDLKPFLNNKRYRRALYQRLGLPEDAEV